MELITHPIPPKSQLMTSTYMAHLHRLYLSVLTNAPAGLFVLCGHGVGIHGRIESTRAMKFNSPVYLFLRFE